MIVCHCTGVTDTTLTQLIQDGAVTVTEITRRCGAGRCCEACREELASILVRARGATEAADKSRPPQDSRHVLLGDVAV